MASKEIADSKMIRNYIIFITFTFIILIITTPCFGSDSKLQLTFEEKAWIDKSHTVRVRIGSAPPFMLTDGEISGIAIDYLTSVFNRNGIKFSYVQESEVTWPQALKYIEQHDVVDMVPTAKITDERKKNMIFTDEYIFAPWVIFTRTDSGFISSIDDLKGKTVSVEEGYVMHDLLKRNYPEINLKVVSAKRDNNYAEIPIKDLSTGLVDAYIGNLLSTTYIIQARGYTNVKVAAPTSFENHNQAMAIRNDWPELVSIINKTIAAMAPEDHAAIRNRWLSIRYEYGINKVYLLKWVLGVAGVASIFILFVLFGNRLLKKEVVSRKRIESELRESEAFIKAVMDNLPIGIAVNSVDPTVEISYMNDNFPKFYRTTREKLADPDIFWEAVYEDTVFREKIKKKVLDDCASGDPKRMAWDDIPITRKGKETVFVNARNTPIPEKQLMISTVWDVTERKQAQEEKLKAQKIAGEQKKLALVGQVAGKMAHDFNNILGIIMGNTELALLDCKEEETRKTLELVFEQTIRGKNLTRNLVAFAKDQEPKQTFFGISEKIDLVLNLLRKDLEGIEITKEVKAGMPDLLADPGMIEHALVNLIQNSIHATSMSEQPQIFIRTFHKDKDIYIEIEDNGCGISEEALDRIYEPAFTMKGSRDITGSYKSGIKGTGYGMANVKKYIEQHKGNIIIDSKVGKGTNITISFPVIKKELTENEIIELKKETVHFEKCILLVEDEQSLSDVQYRILTGEPCNHKVDVAHNGQMAKDLFERNIYDFVSLDYVLPGGINGMDVYHHIRKTNQTVPVLFISGNIEFLESIKELKQKDEYIDHLSKPCQNKDYVNGINALLGKTLAEQ